MALIRFIGTGEAFDPRLPNTSVLYVGRLKVLIDCGYAVPHAFWATGRDPDALDAIYVSHRHADHCFGVPALVVWMRLAGRKRPLKLLGGVGSSVWIREVLESGYAGAYAADRCFPLEFIEVSPTSPIALDGTVIYTAVSAHPMTNHAVRIEADGRAFCYSGDGAPTDATRALFTNAAVLVHECFRAEPGISGHAHLTELLTLQADLGVEILSLVHLDRDPARQGAIVEGIRIHAGRRRVVIPRCGDEIAI